MVGMTQPKTKWEYMTVSSHQGGDRYDTPDLIINGKRTGTSYQDWQGAGLIDNLNKLGQDNWELIKIRSYSGGITYFFKRPV